jgi:uncharacterized membrane protein
MTSSTVRHAYLDWVRGVAVLIMIEAHALDGWTHAADRARPLFGYAMILGGFGAPLFLFLAGLTGVLSAESKLRKTGDFAASWRAVQQRGWQVFGLAFLFRLQSYILSGAQSALSLLKVDILNVMGPAIAMTALTGRMAQKKVTRGLLFAAGAGAITLLTPIVRAAPQLAWLPDPVEWYFRPMPGRTNFSLFPWAGFVLAGAAVGVVVGGLRPANPFDVTQGRPFDVAQGRRARQLQVTLAIAGGLLVWLAHEASLWPPLHEGSDYWTTSLSFFLLRVGLLTLLLPIGYAWTHAPLRHKFSSWSPLEEFGRASLFVYWIHVEMVYGFFSRPIRRSLSLEAALAAYMLFTVFLLGVVRLKSWLVQERAIYLTDSKSVI